MPRYFAQGKKALEAFLKSREARSTLQEMVRRIPEDSPALQPLLNAARTFNGRLLSLSGMPERPIEVVEQEAIEAAQQLQTALNDLSSQQPELYRQHAEAFERTWQGLKLEIEGAAPQAQAQEVPKAGEAQKAEEAPKAQAAPKDSEHPEMDVLGKDRANGFVRYVARAMKENSPDGKLLNDLNARITEHTDKLPQKERKKYGGYYVKKILEEVTKTSETVNTEKEASGDSQLGAYQFNKLKTSLIRLKKSDPEAYNKIYGPFFEAAGKLDLSMDQEKYTSMRKAKKAREAAAAEADKKSLAELESRKVTLYGNVEVMENSGIHYYEKVRNTVIRSTSPVRQRWAPPII